MTTPFRPFSRWFVALTFCFLCLHVSSSAAGQAAKFTLPPGCTLPFDDIASKPDPFQQCGNCGVVSSGEAQSAGAKAKALQSAAKNDFCADISQVAVVDFADLRQMGTKATSLDVPDLPSRQKLHGIFNLNGKSIG